MSPGQSLQKCTSEHASRSFQNDRVTALDLVPLPRRITQGTNHFRYGPVADKALRYERSAMRRCLLG